MQRLTLLLLGQNIAIAEQKTLHWSGCGVSKLGFMQDLARAYEKKSGVKIILEGGGTTKGLHSVALQHMDLGGNCRLPLSTVTATAATR